MNIAKAANMCEVGGRDGRGGMTDRFLQLVLLSATCLVAGGRQVAGGDA
jgi:hypothetical protein